jgi:magnesium chelatase family protein
LAKTVAFRGIEAVPVEIQVKLLPGLSYFVVVGLPDKVVGESRERVKSAISGMGLSFPLKRIVVNLSPADLVKEGSHYDLPIAAALLGAMGIIREDSTAGCVIVGELTLDGDITKVNGVLSAAHLAKSIGYSLVCPWDNYSEANLVKDLNILAPQSLLQLINHLNGRQPLPKQTAKPYTESQEHARKYPISDVKGHIFAKRAAEVAVAGGHHVTFVGPPGAGKSMLARCMVGLLPPMSHQEAIELSMIRSVAGEAEIFSMQRPYRAPHHSCSMAAMIGGGKKVKPGEISLAHHGVLFLDELPEFSSPTLEALRQPLENKAVTIARAESHITYPADFQLVTAMNPCRCGYAGTNSAQCSNQTKCMLSYTNKISGPMLDRIDISVYMESVDILAYSHTRDDAESDDLITGRVIAARAIQRERYQEHGIHLNAKAKWELLRQYAMPDADGLKMIKAFVQKHGLSTRAVNKIFQVARTIADLQGVDAVGSAHVAEAMLLRARHATEIAISVK